MRGVLLRPAETRTGLYIIQIRDKMIALSSCCQRTIALKRHSTRDPIWFCEDCRSPIAFSPPLEPDPDNTESVFRFEEGRWLPSELIWWVETWSGLLHNVDMTVNYTLPGYVTRGRGTSSTGPL